MPKATATLVADINRQLEIRRPEHLYLYASQVEMLTKVGKVGEDQLYAGIPIVTMADRPKRARR